MAARAIACAVLFTIACSEDLRVLDREAPGSNGAEECMCRAPDLCLVNECVNSSGITEVGAGSRHVCRVADGALSCWGENRQGQLGVTETDDQRLPVRVGDESSWLKVASGDEHTCAIAAPGLLYCWGNNSAGQLGNNDTTSQRLPGRVAGPEDFVSVACGGLSSCALSNDGRLYCWGESARMFAGPGDVMDKMVSPELVAVPIEIQPDHRWLDVSVGARHVCAITTRRELHCWGDNQHGQLGIGSATAMPQPPTAVAGGDWFDVAAGEHHTCGIRDGQLYCWGRAESGELGIGSRSADRPARVGDAGNWRYVSVGGAHSCAVRRNNWLYCWGRNNEGQVGAPNRASIAAPTLIPDERFGHVFCGAQHTCGLSGGTMYCWGSNDAGQLGLDGITASQTPMAVD